MPLPLTLFFFYCYGDHRDLHSFPTRRSSDLGPRFSTVRLPQNTGKGCAIRTAMLAATGQVIAFTDADLPFRLVGLDRKSTRLNSSHMSISYAVFCLKKKK